MNTNITPASVASRLTDEDIELMAHCSEDDGWSATASVLRDYVRLRRLASTVKEKVEKVKPLTEIDTVLPTPWSAKASKWGIRDVEIYDADGHHITTVEECYPSERRGSAFVIPLAVNAIYDIKRLLAEAEKGEAK